MGGAYTNLTSRQPFEWQPIGEGLHVVPQGILKLRKENMVCKLNKMFYRLK